MSAITAKKNTNRTNTSLSNFMERSKVLTIAFKPNKGNKKVYFVGLHLLLQNLQMDGRVNSGWQLLQEGCKIIRYNKIPYCVDVKLCLPNAYHNQNHKS